MEVKKDLICRFCGKLFCCVNCKKKHIASDHSEVYMKDCPLCNNADLVLRYTAIEPFFAHIVQHHLPLGCVKCNIIAETETDMRKMDHTCVLVKVNPLPTAPQPDIVVSSPPPMAIPVANESKAQNTTPKFNLMSQLVGHGAGNNNLVRSASTVFNGTCSQVTRLIRSTSTPTVQELTCVLKTTNQFLNGSVSQISSICNHSSVIATTPPLGITPMAPKVENFKLPLYQKMRSKGTNVTPLRQVMSQNVQRALMNHDFLSSSSSAVQQQLNCPSPGSQPLDLRVHKSPERIETNVEVVEEIVEELDVPAMLLKTPIKDYTHLSADSPNDSEFFTPHNNNAKQRTRRRRSSIFVQVDEYECSEDDTQQIEVLSSSTGSYLGHDNYELDEPKISLWNVLSTVFRFASNRLMPKTESVENLRPAIMGRSVEDMDTASSSTKRRLTSPTQSKSPQSPRNPPPKRIRGRPPIARMRSIKANGESSGADNL